MSDRVKGALAIAALIAGGIAVMAGVVFGLVAGAQGSHGGLTALVGGFLELPLAAVASILGLVGTVIASKPRSRRLAVIGLALGVIGPILFVVITALFVPASAFRI